MRIKIAINFISVKEIELASLKKLVEVILDVLFCANEPYKVLVPTFKTIPSKIQKTASTMYKNKINVANKTNSSELVSPYIGFLSIFCTELSAPIGRDALCQRPSTTRLTTVNKVLHNR